PLAAAGASSGSASASGLSARKYARRRPLWPFMPLLAGRAMRAYIPRSVSGTYPAELRFGLRLGDLPTRSGSFMPLLASSNSASFDPSALRPSGVCAQRSSAMDLNGITVALYWDRLARPHRP